MSFLSVEAFVVCSRALTDNQPTDDGAHATFSGDLSLGSDRLDGRKVTKLLET
jgi:hypothetical protein